MAGEVIPCRNLSREDTVFFSWNFEHDIATNRVFVVATFLNSGETTHSGWESLRMADPRLVHQLPGVHLSSEVTRPALLRVSPRWPA